MAYAISGIAHWDWPENWPALFDVLVSCLREESEYAVHGAMRVLTEFSRDVTDTQLPNVGPIILQEMYRIFQSENVNVMKFEYLNIFYIIFFLCIVIFVSCNSIRLERVVVQLRFS